ncbi:macrolide-specific efflux system membrane fusion protein [Amycolatopsis thermophila]|uniref:Macrolide-specific efflux system membrane fusion protein n=1 Tax=Amycolatopsis thermophila TaxID=206084 RepID=A0ABU0EUX6_9PSEU|nr:macrolide-specific efflux system membrane fusion protein [Amycolatopsis thermophila]
MAKGKVTETVSAAGTIASSYTADVGFSTSGKVESIDVAVGDVVTKGQKLATLDSTEADQQLAVAKSNLEVARENVDAAATANRSVNGAQGGASESTASLQAKVDSAELAVQQAQDAVDATTLTAPGDGTVTAINGAVGQRTGNSSGSGSQSGSGTSGSSGSSAFIVLTDLKNLVVTTSVAEVDVSKVRAGQTAAVTINALPGTSLQATVASVDLTPTTSDSVVSYGAKLTLSNPREGLRPGQSASVVITTAEADGVLTVPAAAVQTSGDTSTVAVEQNGQQVRKRVEVGVGGESTVESKASLTEGEQVVLTATAATQGATGGSRTAARAAPSRAAAGQADEAGPAGRGRAQVLRFRRHRGARAARGRPDRVAGGVRRDHGRVRVGQVDAAEHPRLPGHPDRRALPARRFRGRRPQRGPVVPAAQPQDRVRVPVVQPAAPGHRVVQCGAAAGVRGVAPQGAAGTCAGRARPGRTA